MNERNFCFGLLLFCVVLSIGCSDGKPARYTVKGTVTFNGSNVKKGEILILPADGKGRPDAGRIIDGKYELLVTPGDKKVEITASSTDPNLVGPAPKVKNALPIIIPREYIPTRYNSETELRITVLTSKVNEHSFDLTSEQQ